jgi:DNA polymerase III delta prime subunit
MIYGNYQNQKIITELLEKEDGVFLVTGPEGVGKFTFLKEYLKDKNWEKIIIDTEDKFLKIETARKMVSLAVKKSEKRVIVINDFQKFLPLTQNIFLKTLEESLSRTVFVLITHQEEKILPTIKSRSLKIKFGLVSKEETIKVLKEKGFSDEEIKLALEVYPYQPGKAVNFLENKKLIKIFKSFILHKERLDIFEDLEKIFEEKENFDLKNFLELYLLFLRGHLVKNPAKWLNKKKINHLKETLNLYADSDYNLNFEIQLTNLVLNYG